MSDTIEAVFTSDSNGSQWTCSAWDPRTGTNLMVYKGGSAATQNSLVLLRHEYLVTANSTKPMIHIWPLSSQEQVAGARLIVPGKVSSLDISPDGNYLVAAIQETIYVWHVCSGRMMTALSRHFQPISKIKFIEDGSHFVSAGLDGIMIVWNLTKAVSIQQRDVQPLYTFSDHGLSVTDIHVGTGGIRAMLYSASLDRTCRVHDLSTGRQLLNLVFPEPLQCVVVNKLETAAFVGSAAGAIYEFSLVSPPRTKEYHADDEDWKNCFAGHKGGVTCLSLSIDGELLMSGGADEHVSIWHIPSRQLIRTLPHKGSISNAIFTCMTSKLREPAEGKLQRNFVVTNSLKRMVDTEGEDYAIETLVTNAVGLEPTRSDSAESTPHAASTSTENASEIEQLKAKISSLQKVNKELFNYCTKKVLIKD